eukprot:154869_1
MTSGSKKHLGIVLIGNVDAGKSCIASRLLFELNPSYQRDKQRMRREVAQLGLMNRSSKCNHPPISLHTYEISSEIIDRYSCTVYSWEFVNENSSGGSQELRFEITIDCDAFISSFEATIDGEIFVGQTKEKHAANKEYIEAKANDENAILITQPYDDIPNVFQIKTNIDCKSKILLNLKVEQYLQKQFNFNQLNIQILKDFSSYNIVAKYDHIVLNVNIREQSEIYDVHITNDNSIQTEDKRMEHMNRNCSIEAKISRNQCSVNEIKVKYKLKGEQNDSNVIFDTKSNVFVHVISDIITGSTISNDCVSEGIADDINDRVLIPRRVVFVIDRSGSMGGHKWRKTIHATITTLKQLRQSYDRYCIILFDSDIELVQDHIIVADEENISKSIQYLQNASVCGSTNINDALLTAIHAIKTDIASFNQTDDTHNFYMNQIILITDGEPNSGESNTNKIISNIKKENTLTQDKYCSKVSIFAFGVGSDSNSSRWITDLNHSFLKLLALNNHGFYKRIKETTTDVLLNEYYALLSKPILSNISIRYHDKYVSDLTNTRFNTLYSGNDIVICGKINATADAALPLHLTISAITGQEVKHNDTWVTKPVSISKELTIDIHPEVKENDEHLQNQNTERTWAYLKLQQLAGNMFINQDICDASVSPLSLALKYKFVTPWTSMIVVKKKHPERALNLDGNTHGTNDNDLFCLFMDKSKDERARGVTIQCITKEFFTDSYCYTVIDAPGHRDFVRNIISGASQADVALLVVPADKAGFEASIKSRNQSNDKYEAQARQHVRLCSLLGIRQIIVCINKMDECSSHDADDRYNQIKHEVGKMLTKMGYKIRRIPFIPVSAWQGDNINQISSNMPWYKGFVVKKKKQTISGYTVSDALEKVVRIPKRDIKKPLRLPLSGVYKIKGVGDLITGRIEQGSITPGVMIKCYPSQSVGKVFSIEMHHKNVPSASCGDNVGICIKNWNKKPSVGDVLVIDDVIDPNPPRAVARFTAFVFVQHYPNRIFAKHGCKQQKNDFTPLVFVRTAKAACDMIDIKWKLSQFNCKRIENVEYVETGDQAEVVFEPRSPIVLTSFVECHGLGRIAVMDANSLVMIGKVISVEYQ